MRTSSVGLTLLFALGAIGCSGTPAGGDAAASAGEDAVSGWPDAVAVDGLDLPWLVLAVVDGAHTPDLVVINPGNGAVSDPVPALEFEGNHVAVSPMGDRIVYGDHTDGGYTWVVARLSLDADERPLVTEERRFAVVAPGVPAFSSTGRWVDSARGRWDPETGEGLRCPWSGAPCDGVWQPSQDGIHGVLVRTSPGFLVEEPRLFRGLDPVGRIGPAEPFMADGQVSAGGLVASAALAVAPVGPSEALRAPNGALFTGLVGQGGDFITDNIACGTAHVEPVVTSGETHWLHALLDPASGVPPYAEHAPFDTAVLQTLMDVPIEAFPQATPQRGNLITHRTGGAVHQPLAMTGDGEWLLAAVGHEIQVTETACQEIPHSYALIGYRPETGARRVAYFGRAGSLAMPAGGAAPAGGPTPSGQAAYGFTPRGWWSPREGEVLLPAGVSTVASPRGMDIHGDAIEYPNAGSLVTPDGRWAYGSANPGQGLGRLCATELGVDQHAQCVDLPTVIRPIAVAGRALVSPRRSGRARVVHISQTAAHPGQEVVVFGALLGTAGTVSVGGVPVPAADVLEWSDVHVRFRVTEETGSGRVRVDVPNGFEEDARPFYLHRTPTVGHPMGDFPPVVPLHPGLNRLPLSGVDAEALDTVAQVGSSTPDFWFVDPAAGDLILMWGSTEPEVLMTRVGTWTRRTDIVPEAASEDGWQLIAQPGADQGHTFVRLLDAVVERDSGAALRLEGDDVVAGKVTAVPVGFAHDALGALMVTGSPPVYRLQRMVGFLGDPNYWGVAPQLDALSTPVQQGMGWVAVAADDVVLSGSTPSGGYVGAFQRSSDGGLSFDAPLPVPGLSSLQRILAVDSGPWAGFLALDGIPGGNAAPTTVVHLDPAGVVTVGALPAPPASVPPTWWASDAALLAWSSDDATAWSLDTEAADPHWEVLQAAGAAGELAGLFKDEAGARFVAVRTDATLHAAGFDAPTAFSPQGAVDLPGLEWIPSGVAALADGTLAVPGHAEISGPSGGAVVGIALLRAQ